MTTTAKPKRTYEIEALSKGLAVLEALEGTAFEPVKIDRVVQRTQLPKDTVFRTLRTLELRGYAVRNQRGEWSPGRRFIRFAAKAAGGESYDF